MRIDAEIYKPARNIPSLIIMELFYNKILSFLSNLLTKVLAIDEVFPQVPLDRKLIRPFYEQKKKEFLSANKIELFLRRITNKNYHYKNKH